MLTRREFLLGTSAICCAGFSPLTPTISLAAVPTETRLVVIILRGAMDGLDILRPVGDPLFRKYRPSTIGDNELPLDNFYGLHPSLVLSLIHI